MLRSRRCERSAESASVLATAAASWLVLAVRPSTTWRSLVTVFWPTPVTANPSRLSLMALARCLTSAAALSSSVLLELKVKSDEEAASAAA